MDPQKTPSDQPNDQDIPPQEIEESPTDNSSLPDDDPAVDTPQEIVTQPLPVTVHHKSKKGLIFGLVIAAVVLLFSGAAAAYYYEVNKPENVLKRALANSIDTDKVKTVQFSGVLSTEDKASGMNLEAAYRGSLDNKTGAFGISGQADWSAAKVDFDLRTTDRKSYYVRLGGLNGISALLAASGSTSIGSIYAPLVSTFNDKWIKVDQGVIDQVDTPYKSGVNSTADDKKIADAYLKYPFLTIKDVLPAEVIGGKNSYHYRLIVDDSKLKDFATALKNANLDNNKITQGNLNDFKKSVDQNKLEKYPFEVWISKTDKFITQIVLKATQNDTSINFRLTADNYNQTVKIDKPQGAKSFLELVSEYYSSLGL